jgi:5-methylthioadenosine/S-adenosylhomocysteine deaminase
VAHNLQTNMEIGAGIAQVPKMLQKGVTVGIGNDGFIPDMFGVLLGAYLTHKGIEGYWRPSS